MTRLLALAWVREVVFDEVVVGKRKMKKPLQMGEARQNVVVCRSERASGGLLRHSACCNNETTTTARARMRERQHIGGQQAQGDVDR